MRYFFWPILISIIALFFSFYFRKSLEDLTTVILLSFLELSISFDNALVNAKVLNKMSKVWRQLFFWVGLPIAVFGVRLLLPLGLVSWTAGLDLIQTFNLAIHHPAVYQAKLLLNQDKLYAFGAGFLLMVFISFMWGDLKCLQIRPIWFAFEKTKISYWIARQFYFSIGLLFLILFLILGLEKNLTVGFCWIAGGLIQYALYFLGHRVDRWVKFSGLILFVYIECLDASFSLDGVLGAFAFTTDPVLIMLGLGIGALFVRGLTIRFVQKKTLQNFIYIEHGAHYAIGLLGLVLLFEIFVSHIPSGLVGLLSLGLIGMAFYDSKKIKK